MKKVILLMLIMACVTSSFFIGCKKNPPIENKKPPNCTSNTAPVNNTNVSTTTVTLSWTAASGATSYDVYVGGSAANTTKAGSSASTSYIYTIPSSANATYYWYVVPKNADGSAMGCSSNATSFVYGTAPGCASNIEPANSSTVTIKTVTLKWSKVNNSTGYDVYLGTSALPTTTIATNVTDTVFTYSIPANYTTTYYWYVVPKNTSGSGTTCTSSVTAFTYLTVPGTATNVSPANGEPVTGAVANLKWLKVTGAVSYDIYAGESAGTATLVSANVTDTVYAYTLPATNLSKTIYWYVVPKNTVGSATNSQAAATSFVQLIIKTPATLDFPLYGYIQSAKIVAEYPDAMWKMLDIVAYAFASINATGTGINIGGTKLDSVRNKAQANGAKAFLAINGNHSYFTTMVNSDANRLAFIKDVMNKVRQYNLDGIDMDWEYPRTSDNTHIGYEAMMKQLADSLHVDGKYYLSAAVTSGKYVGSATDAITNNVIKAVDMLNIMIYDDFAPNDSTERYRSHADMNFFNTCLNYWKGRFSSAGVSMKKCMLGVPVYGRPSWEPQVSSTILSYKTITVKGVSAGPASIYDSDSAWVNNGGIYTNFKIYYNGRPTVKAKTAKAFTDAGGVMFWELGHDKNDEYSLIKAAYHQLGRTL